MQQQIEKLHLMVPKATVIAALVNPNNPVLAEPAMKEAQAAGHTLGLQIHIIQARTEHDIDAAFAALVPLGAGGLVVCPDPLLTSRRAEHEGGGRRMNPPPSVIARFVSKGECGGIRERGVCSY